MQDCASYQGLPKNTEAVQELFWKCRPDWDKVKRYHSKESGTRLIPVVKVVSFSTVHESKEKNELKLK